MVFAGTRSAKRSVTRQADARVARRASKYLGLSKKDKAPGTAKSSGMTRVMTAAGSPVAAQLRTRQAHNVRDRNALGRTEEDGIAHEGLTARPEGGRMVPPF